MVRPHRRIAVGGGLAGVASMALLVAAALPADRPVPGGEAGPQDASARGDEYFRRGYYQEAAWAYAEAGRGMDRDRALDSLRRLLLSPALGSRQPERDPREPGTNDRALVLEFAGGVSAFFKPEGSLLRCLMCDVRYEAAAWKIDSVAGFDLVPMTVLGAARLGPGPEVRGSIQYFVRDARKAYAAFSPGPEYVPVEEHKSDRLRFLDALVGNADRHGGNWLVRETGEIAAIDNDNIFAHDDRSAPTRWPEEVARVADPRALVASEPFARVKKLPDSVWIDLLAGLVPADRLALFLRTKREIVAALEARARSPGLPSARSPTSLHRRSAPARPPYHRVERSP